MKAAAVLLAAGESRRMGRAKASLPFRGGTFLTVLAAAAAELCKPVIAVFGHDAESLASMAQPPVIAVVNENFRLGMLTSLQVGLRAVPADCDRVLFTPVDHPAVHAATFRAVLETDAPIAIPRYGGRRGHPVAISRAIALEFAAEPVSSRVHDVVNRHAASIHYIDVPDPGILDDIDNPGLYRELLARETFAAR